MISFHKDTLLNITNILKTHNEATRSAIDTFCCLLITFANSLDQDRGHDLNPNFLGSDDIYTRFFKEQ